jgi:hypothetical protein
MGTMWTKAKTRSQDIIVFINDDIILEWWSFEQDIQHEGKGDYCSKHPFKNEYTRI